MSAETQQLKGAIEEGVSLLRRHLDWENALSRLDELKALSEDPKLWDNPDNAQKLMRELTVLGDKVKLVQETEKELQDSLDLVDMAEEEGDAQMLSDITSSMKKLAEKTRSMQLLSLLSGEADGYDAYIEVNSGAGGTEACDWAEMLMRMYMRWADKRGFKVQVMDRNDGDEAGIRSATLQISGDYAYGWAKTESGVHRLVRISPYDSSARRHTSFASVSVTPVVDEDFDIEVLDKDLKIDTYRSSGAGGQHVNTTDSAIRITHMPTGIVVACQAERSQHKNRATAMGMLKARLYELELQKKEQAAQDSYGEKSEIGWGHQIRSYVLHPYQMVKDLRTGVENTQAHQVLDGDLDAYLEAALAQKAGTSRD
ncbi:MAG: peptide chain release factor 2 [Pseudobdellovibrionaceae bacterium]